MMKEFGFKYVVSTLRESFSATHNGWKAMIYNGEEFYTSKRYDIDPIIDRVGGGDSFSGGIIHGLMLSLIHIYANRTFCAVAGTADWTERGICRTTRRLGTGIIRSCLSGSTGLVTKLCD